MNLSNLSVFEILSLLYWGAAISSFTYTYLDVEVNKAGPWILSGMSVISLIIAIVLNH